MFAFVFFGDEILMLDASSVCLHGLTSALALWPRIEIHYFYLRLPWETGRRAKQAKTFKEVWGTPL